jgi:3-hydroxyisobutyrate dehydrogenase
MSELPSVAVLGTGIMGGAMARRLGEHGFPLALWNRDEAKARAVADAVGSGEVRVAPQAADAVVGADLILTVLADGDVTEQVAREAIGTFADGAVWIQMGTVGIEATERLAEIARHAGVTFVDAPVLGTKGPAEAGQLTVLASGPEDAHEACQPVFDVVAASGRWLGPAGAGSRMKLVVNGWLAALLAGLAESVALAEGIGVDPAEFLDVIDGGPIGPAYARIKGDLMVAGEYPTSFPLDLLAKDVRLVGEAAAEAGVPLRLPAAIGDLLAAASADHGDDDMAAVVEALRDR